MSDTPRTDHKLFYAPDDYMRPVVDADFARQLEAELTELKHTYFQAHSGSYWLIERGSPCEWWVSGSGNGGGAMIHEEWTTDSSKAQHFNEWGAKHHAKELEQWGVKGPLRVTEHSDCKPEPC